MAIPIDPDIEKTALPEHHHHQPDINTTPTTPTHTDSQTTCTTPDTEQEDDFEPPDGGLTAWSQVLAGCLINMLSWGYPSAFGVYQLHYRDTLHLPEAQVSWIGSIQVFMTFSACIFSGRLADAGFIKSTIACGACLTVFGTMMTSIAGATYWQIFLAQGVCTGLGLGVMFMPPLAVINSYFRAKRSTALAVAATGTGIGSVVFPATVQYLIPRVGFAWAVRCSGLVTACVAAVAIALLRPRLRPRVLGMLVDWEALREGPYVLYMMGSFLFLWALYFGFFYINAFARNIIHFSTTDSVQLLLLLNGMSVPSRPLVGFLADRYMGPINMFCLTTPLLAGMIFAWTGVASRAGMYAFAVFFGLSNGAAQGVMVGSLASLTADPRKMGTRFGMVCTVSAFATLAGPPTAGAIIDRDGGRYLWAQVWAGAVVVLAAVTLAGARCAVTGWRVWVKV
ncbi:major facilitator superfamily domain-containing protein [Bombardia bombarda]|uniref:Major facilitator superfamily domain-containing protein n=1 Tax=Bombardia bombarda TaxID=252184 RepID=A0AA39XLT2_9PEZI|nr:major facilitator superfamily domain-containing protein [Bombardia bombarda]